MTIADDVAGYIGVDRGMVLDRFRKAVAERSEKAIERPKSLLRHDERMLLNALLFDAGTARRSHRRVALSEDHRHAAFAAYLSGHFYRRGGGGRVGFDEINGRLEEADQNLLAQAVLNEDGEVARDEVIASVVSMQRSEQQNLRAELKSRIGEAERAGHFDEAVRLTMELQGLERAERGRRQ